MLKNKSFKSLLSNISEIAQHDQNKRSDWSKLNGKSLICKPRVYRYMLLEQKQFLEMSGDNSSFKFK